MPTLATPATPPAKPPKGVKAPSFLINGIFCSIPIDDMGDGAIVEGWGTEGPTATVYMKCAYADRYTVVRGLRGGVTVSGKGWIYTPPLRYPPSPNMLCTSLGDIKGLRPWTDATGWLQYDFAIIPVNFSVPTWSAIDQPSTDASGLHMTTTKFRGSPEIVAPPGDPYYYTAGSYSGKPVAESSVAIIKGKVEISMTRHQVPFPYLDGPLWLEGCANSSPVTFGDRTFPRGTLLFASFDSDFQPDPATGDPAWDYTFTLLGNDIQDWNEVNDPTGELVLINTAADASGDFPYPYEDFSLLFSDDLQAPPGD